jgi:DNA helicase-4
LIKPIYNTYEEFLKLEGIIDFNDMINEAINVLNKELKDDKSKFQYDYILVDEYQDIAQDTFNLIKALKERSNASIMCVGDDWQSIYSWKGSDLKFFNKFNENFEITSSKEFKVTQTYRYGQNLANISSKFITQNKNQKNKKISSNEQKTKIIPYRSENGWQNLLNTIQKDYGTDKTIKVLLRYNNDFKIIGKNTIEELRNELWQRFTNKDNDVVTIHRAKGLEADIIIILNMIKGKFPSEKVSDPVLQYFSKYRSDDDYPYAEERRLFYVAMTRAKKACYLYLPSEGQESVFWDEIKDDPNIEHEQ